MSPTELKFKDRLDSTVERMTQMSKTDALNNTTGWVRKQRLMDSSGDHSCLKRGKRPWVDQAVTTHTFFSDYDAYQPGDNEYETGLERFIVQSDRGLNHQRQIIVGDEQQKSFWNCPTGSLHGSNRRQTRAQELLFKNTRGATGLKPASPSGKNKVLLKGTGSLSFSHFKDALVQPAYERFSPGDRSQPP